MMKVLRPEDLHLKLPVKMWTDDVEEGALKQIYNLANFPYAFRHVAIMPDVHQGYGMPIGGVLATKEVIIPNAVGVDIGCGMVALPTDLSIDDLNIDTIKRLFGFIRKSIPVGFNHHKKRQDKEYMPPVEYEMPIVKREYEKAYYQVGTLGGGNHFIEIQKDKNDNNRIWIMVHSGSRNIGKQVADNYNKIAREFIKKNYPDISPKWDLACLPLDSKEGKTYQAEMEYCIAFAYKNRKLMMNRIIDSFINVGFSREPFRNNMSRMINIAHNYASLENHFDHNVIVHRKGATRAQSGEIGIIPGSQGTVSFIIEGLGNEESFKSCSHGAGRTMGRKQAQRTLDLQKEVKRLNDQGIIHSIRGIRDLDEAPSAYKNIDVVLENQKDLVRIKHRLTPLAVVKG
jgi:tRNA-splicing ligase RtcB